MFRTLFKSCCGIAVAGGVPARRATPNREVLYESLERRAVLSTFVVQHLGDAGPGSLRAAIEQANTQPGPDIIRFKQGLAGTIALTSGELAVTDAVRIQGPGESRLTVSGNLQNRVFRIDSGNGDVTLRGFTIADGRARELEDVGIQVIRGGGILNLRGQLRLFEMTFRNNRAEAVGGEEAADVVGGGAIASSENSVLQAIRCTFTSNSASGGARYAFGGAIAVVTGSQAFVRGTVFDGNFVANGAANYGGAVAAFGGSSAGFFDTTFTANQAIGTDEQSAFGGALAARPGTVENSPSELFAMRCEFRGNAAEAAAGATAGGGAIYNRESFLVLRQSTLRANWAAAGNVAGGALQSELGFGMLLESRLVSNQAIGIPNAEGYSLARGGAVASVGGGMLTLAQTKVLLNTARGAQAYGGGIFHGDVEDEAVSILGLQRAQVNENRAVSSSSTTTGVAQGGGIFHGNRLTSEAPAVTALVSRTQIDRNSAVAEGSGSGVGGGIYSNGDFSVDARLNRRLLDNLAANFATTSHPNVFGSLTVL